jgi:transcriptional regulator with XRE-family HTH domain
MADIHSVLSKIIGKSISELRRFNNDNQQQLADKIGIKRSSVSNMELGNQQISLVILYRICQVYNTEIYSLLPRVNEVASQVSLSLEIDQVTEILKTSEVGSLTQQKILDLLK